MSDAFPIVPGYRIEKFVATGAFSSVWKGFKNNNNNIPFAIKIVKKPAPPLEVSVWRSLKHPNIVALIEVIELSDSMVYVSEYVEGVTLAEYIKKKLMKEKAIKKVCRQLGSAVAHCHEMGFAHRDIKLENIIYTSQKSIKLVDFGLACPLGPSTKFSGTLYYSPPEVLMHKEFDPVAADLWSIGVTLFALMNGALPFDGPQEDSIAQAIFAVQNRPFENHLSDEAVDFVCLLLVSDPKERLPLSMFHVHPWLRSEGFSLSSLSKKWPWVVGQKN